MPNKKLAPGALIKVYQKHLTQEDYEGLARLVKDLDHGDDEMGYRWEVRFIGARGHDEVTTYERWVHARDLK